jgi:hypothetical protein
MVTAKSKELAPMSEAKALLSPARSPNIDGEKMETLTASEPSFDYEQR